MDNSKGISLPKSLLLQTGMTERVEIEARGHNIILKPVKEPRSGWKASFAKGGASLNKEDVRGSMQILLPAKVITGETRRSLLGQSRPHCGQRSKKTSTRC